LCGSGISVQESDRDATVLGRPAFNLLVAEVRQQAAEIGLDGPGVSLVKIEKAHLCRVDQNLTVVKIAVNKT
jgi:hypothetical protein